MNLPESPGATLLRGRTSVVPVCALGYVVLASYALARPPSESLFLARYGSTALPYVWLAVAASTASAVAVYNRFASRVDLVKLFDCTLVISAGSLVVILIGRAAHVGAADFVLYVWKDVYVVLLLELIWSIANSVFSLSTARWAYGLFCLAGSLGGITGNLIVGELAAAFGAGTSLWFVLPLLFVAGVCSRMMTRFIGRPGPVASAKQPPSMFETIRVLRTTRYVSLMVILIALVQVVITLIDYQYNTMIEVTFPDADERTAVMGRVYALIDAASISLQFLSFPLFRYVGLSITLLGIPCFLGLTVLGFAAQPRFASVALAKVASKAFDYSVFKAAKEILYIPLSYLEKTMGKAVVDVFTYRVAKAGASLLLLVLTGVPEVVNVATVVLVLLVLWFAVTATILKRFRALSRQGSDEAGG